MSRLPSISYRAVQFSPMIHTHFSEAPFAHRKTVNINMHTYDYDKSTQPLRFVHRREHDKKLISLRAAARQVVLLPWLPFISVLQLCLVCACACHIRRLDAGVAVFERSCGGGQWWRGASAMDGDGRDSTRTFARRSALGGAAVGGHSGCCRLAANETKLTEDNSFLHT